MTHNNRLFPTDGVYGTTSVNMRRLPAVENKFHDTGARTLLRSQTWGCRKVCDEWGLIYGHDNTGVPLFERFFVGGPLTVRGFERNTLSPTLSMSEAPYGTSYRINKAEPNNS